MIDCGKLRFSIALAYFAGAIFPFIHFDLLNFTSIYLLLRSTLHSLTDIILYNLANLLEYEIKVFYTRLILCDFFLDLRRAHSEFFFAAFRMFCHLLRIFSNSCGFFLVRLPLRDFPHICPLKFFHLFSFEKKKCEKRLGGKRQLTACIEHTRALYRDSFSSRTNPFQFSVFSGRFIFLFKIQLIEYFFFTCSNLFSIHEYCTLNSLCIFPYD